MLIFPAIDIMGGQCVRLTQGKFDEMTVYYRDPVEVAKKWEEKGAEFIHVVDLDGAKEGKPKNIEVIKKMVKSIDIPIQVGGGIRTAETAKQLLNLGVQRVILGTAAITSLEFIKEIVEQYNDRIVISIDAKDGQVATEGWLEISEVSSLDLVERLDEIGVSTIVYTDIAKDGMMEGPNFDVYRELKRISGINIIASGGISNREDVNQLQTLGIYGAIIGKALYQGSIKLEELGDLYAS